MKKHLNKLLLVFGIALVLSIFYTFFGREYMLMTKGNAIINKIEKYHKKYHKLPDSLEEIGIAPVHGKNEIFYDKRDNINYTVSFSISIDYNKFYYSDSKKWENGYRIMKHL